MATNRISNDELFDSNLFGGDVKKKAEELIKVLNQLEAEFIKVAEAQKQILETSGQGNTAKETEKTEKALKKLNETQKQTVRLRNQRVRLQRTISDLTAQEAKDIAKLKVEVTALRKQRQQEAQLASESVGAYQKLSIQTNILIKRYKDLAASQGRNSAEARKTLKAVLDNQKALKTFDRDVGQFGRNVGNYTSALGQLRNAFIRVASAAGVSFGIFGAFRLGQDVINTVREFEDQTAILAGVLGKTRKEIVELSDDAIRLGSVTAVTASQVVELQVAYSRLGFTQAEILVLTEDTIAGSIALNAELDETAELAGAVVRTFNQFSVNDIGEILDKLTISTQRSALNFQKLQTALPIVGGAANAAGISFDRLLALLGKLADAGLDASQSSTALRNIFLEAAKTGRTYEQILVRLRESFDQLAESSEEVGKRAAVPASILTENIKLVDELEKELQEFNGAAKRAADERIKTLTGAIQLLNSAWRGYILILNRSIEGSDRLSRVILFLGRNLGRIIGLIVTFGATFASYRLAVGLATVATNLFNAATRTATVTVTGFGAASTKATTAVRGLNLALSANTFGAIVAVATAAIGVFQSLNVEAIELRKNIKRLNAVFNEGRRLTKAFNSLRDEVEEIDEASRRSVLALQRDVESEIELTVAKLRRIADIERRLGLEVVRQRRERNRRITQLEEQLSEETVDIRRQSLEAQLGLERSALADLDERVRRGLLGNEGITREAAEEQLRQLEDFLRRIRERLAQFQRNLDGSGDNEITLKAKIDFDDFEGGTFNFEDGIEVKLRPAIEPPERTSLLDQLRQEARIIEEQIRLGLDFETEGALSVDRLEELSAEYASLQEQIRILNKEYQRLLGNVDESNTDLIDRAQLIQDILLSLSEIANQVFENQISNINDQLLRTAATIERLNVRATNQRLASQESIAFEEKRQRELERRAEKTRRAQLRTQALFTVLETYNRNDLNLSKTIADVAVLQTISSGLAGFFEGTDDTGKKGSMRDQYGAITGYTHENEMVFSKAQKEAMGNKSRDEIIQIVRDADANTAGFDMLRSGDIKATIEAPKLSGKPTADAYFLGKRLKKLERSIENIELSSDHVTIDSLRNILIHERKRGNKTTTTKSKLH